VLPRMQWHLILLVLSKLMSKLQWGVLTVWIAFTLSAFGYLIKDRLVEFDESNKLAGVGSQELSGYLLPYAKLANMTGQKTLLHFSTPSCECQQYSEKHIKDLNKLAGANDFLIKNVVINEHNTIPSTPSVALIDESGEVVYFGPYGQGLACSQTSGYAQTMLNNYLKGYAANLVVKEAKGCYCNV
jgi:thioredoxin-related protein